MRVAYSLEQCWHRVPGGTATSAIEIAKTMSVARPDVQLIGVAGRHKSKPELSYRPPINVHQLALRGPALYETSLRLGLPHIEWATGKVDLLHCTSVIPFASRAKMVATVHDLAFLKYPEFFSSRGNSVFRRSLKILLKRAEILLCSSQATLNDCAEYGFASDRLRHVPLGVSAPVISQNAAEVRRRYGLNSDYLLFVGTLEPRKNLTRLVEAIETLGDSDELGALYAGASAFCYPSLMEGFGLPILEAMSCGVPVVTSRGSSTQEVAGDAAVLVDPRDTTSIANGITDALKRRVELVELGYNRAAKMTWKNTAIATAAIYDEVVG